MYEQKSHLKCKLDQWILMELSAKHLLIWLPILR